MKATVSAKILKAALKTLKQVNDCFQRGTAEAAYGFNLTEHGLCLQLIGDVFGSYLICDQVDDFQSFVPVDGDVLASLKFPQDQVCLEAFAGYLRATSDALNVELVSPVNDSAKLKQKKVDLEYKFKVRDLEKALDFHSYGAHHNPAEAEKRLVRLFSRGDKLCLQSFDKQVSAFNEIPVSQPLTTDIFVVPKPMSTTLSNIPDEYAEFGFSKQHWRISTPKLDVVFPNAVKPVVADFSRILDEIESKPSIKIAFKTEHVKKTLSVLSPGIKAGKDENPKMSLFPSKIGHIQVTLVSEKIRSMSFQLEGEITEDGIELDGSDIKLNFRYTREFVDNLGGDGVQFQYWKFQDEKAPLKGRTVSFFNENGRYIIARITL